MRDDVRKLQDILRATEFACVPPGVQSTSGDFYPAVQSTYPELCDDDLRCDDVCTNGADQPEWKHGVRRVQQQLGRRENTRLSSHDTRGKWRVKQPNLFLIPVSDEWIGRFKNTVQTPVERDSDAPDTIASLLPARVWGATAGSQTEQYFDEMRPRDCVLFYRDGDFFAGGIVGRTLDDHSVGAWIWDNPESRFIFTLEEYYDWAPAITRIWDALGYNGTPRVQGFLRVKPARLENLCGDEKSLERALFGTVNETLSETAGNSPGAASSAHDQSPEGTTTERDRLLRDQTLVTELKSLYNHTCQLCGYRLQRGLDAGYAEVHHIKPLGDPHCGPDVPENMLVLCPNHHVDFDNGMLTVAPASYTVNHMYDDSVSDSQLTLSDGHQIRAAFLDYHNEVIAE